MPNPRTVTVYAVSQTRSTCHGCGRPILWCFTYPRKKRIPMEIGSVALSTFEAPTPTHNAIEVHDAAKTHFATCPAAKQFRSTKKLRS
jgi:hypothetical protein